MIIDMHNHTNISSICSVLRPEELIETARSRGLDGICVTEHNTLQGANVAADLGRRMKFPVFRGLEVSTDVGDMLVFGYYKDIPQGTPLPELCKIVHAEGGVLFAAHPFYLRGGWNLYSGMKKKMRIDLETGWWKAEILGQLDGIEIRNGNVDHDNNRKAEELAERLHIPGIGGSDAHSVDMIAKAATKFSKDIHDEAQLVAALKSGEFEAMYLRRDTMH